MNSLASSDCSPLPRWFFFFFGCFCFLFLSSRLLSHALSHHILLFSDTLFAHQSLERRHSRLLAQTLYPLPCLTSCTSLLLATHVCMSLRSKCCSLFVLLLPFILFLLFLSRQSLLLSSVLVFFAGPLLFFCLQEQWLCPYACMNVSPPPLLLHGA